MSGPLCDAVLESADSAEELGALERSNLFVVALDRHGGWYRYHHLFGELLRAELERAEADLVPGLLARASDWCGANGEPQAAVGYAQAAGDVDRVAALVGAHAQSEYEHGRAVTAEQWFSWLEDRSSMEQHPGVAVLGAWLSAIRGRPDQSERWADVAERRASCDCAERRLDRAVGSPCSAPLSAVTGWRGWPQTPSWAATGFGRASPFWPTAAVLLALSHQFSGDDERADDLLAEVAEMAVALELSNPGSLAFSLRALIAIERQDWVAAEELTERAESIARRARMEDYPLNAVVLAASARFAIHRGEQSRADQHLARAQRLRPQLTRALAPFSIHVRIQLARADAARADVAGARTLLRETNDLLRRGPDFGTRAVQANELSSHLQTVGRAGPGASSLTTAELRLIPFLPTHLSFREVGERLYVSHNTVRTQVRSIYLKLDVTSRERSRRTGTRTRNSLGASPTALHAIWMMTARRRWCVIGPSEADDRIRGQAPQSGPGRRGLHSLGARHRAGHGRGLRDWPRRRMLSSVSRRRWRSTLPPAPTMRLSRRRSPPARRSTRSLGP